MIPSGEAKKLGLVVNKEKRGKKTRKFFTRELGNIKMIYIMPFVVKVI